ncbi:hypothetical protein [Methylopila sp. M107]|uniref:hypothetical protein n=1 Tax=Methylopila sp. M107 TaxID=1101190 RepID=UPI000377EC74|nr:hypothetical protein [Methylopila sp. M107]
MISTNDVYNADADAAFFEWPSDQDAICRKIAGRKAPMKVMLKTKNETTLLEKWVEHHARIVGHENLIIADNISDNSETLDLLRRLQTETTVFRFAGENGVHASIHDRRIFRKLYSALSDSCEFYIFLDTDERLVWIEDDRWTADESVVQKIQESLPFGILPTAWPANFALSEDTFYYAATRTHDKNIIYYGKPIVSTSTKSYNKGNFIHNLSFPTDMKPKFGSVNAFTLHLKHLDPEQRLRSNRNTLISHKRVHPDSSLEDIAAQNDAEVASGRRPFGHAQEIADILGMLSGVKNKTWGPSDKSHSFTLEPDGAIRYSSKQVRDRFRDFVRDGARHFGGLVAAHEAQALARRALTSPDLLEEAEAKLRRGIRQFPRITDQWGHPTFRKELMRLLLTAGRIDDATALIPAPGGPGKAGWHHHLFGRAFYNLGRHDEARAHWEAFIVTHPGHTEALAGLKAIANDPAAAPLDSARKPDAPKAESDAVLSIASSDVKKGVFVQPDNATANHQTASRTLALAKKTGDIEAGLRRLMAEQPDLLDQHGHPTYRKELIRLLLAKGRIDEARAVSPGPDDFGHPVWHHILFGRALEKAGAKDDARLHWEACLSLDPGNREARTALKPATSFVLPAEFDPAAPLLPRVSKAELALLELALEGVENYLEFGAGGSTSVAAQIGVKRIVSVESDKEWLDMLAKRPEVAAVDFTPIYIDIGRTGKWGKPIEPDAAPRWPAYHQDVWSRLAWHPDLVFIDGRFRVACALATLLNCRPGTPILIHDFWNRPQYHEVLKYLDVLDRADSLGLFQAKPGISTEELQADLSRYAQEPS